MNQAMLQNLSAYALPIVAVLSMYLLVIMPQKKREKKNRELINSVKEGLDIITIGGIMGKIVNIKDDEITIVTSVEKTQLKIMRWAVKEILRQETK